MRLLLICLALYGFARALPCQISAGSATATFSDVVTTVYAEQSTQWWQYSPCSTIPACGANFCWFNADGRFKGFQQTSSSVSAEGLVLSFGKKNIIVDYDPTLSTSKLSVISGSFSLSIPCPSDGRCDLFDIGTPSSTFDNYVLSQWSDEHCGITNHTSQPLSSTISPTACTPTTNGSVIVRESLGVFYFYQYLNANCSGSYWLLRKMSSGDCLNTTGLGYISVSLYKGNLPTVLGCSNTIMETHSCDTDNWLTTYVQYNSVNPVAQSVRSTCNNSVYTTTLRGTAFTTFYLPPTRFNVRYGTATVTPTSVSGNTVTFSLSGAILYNSPVSLKGCVAKIVYNTNQSYVYNATVQSDETFTVPLVSGVHLIAPHYTADVICQSNNTTIDAYAVTSTYGPVTAVNVQPLLAGNPVIGQLPPRIAVVADVRDLLGATVPYFVQLQDTLLQSVAGTVVDGVVGVPSPTSAGQYTVYINIEGKTVTSVPLSIFNFPSGPSTILSPVLIPQSNTTTQHRVQFADSNNNVLPLTDLDSLGFVLTLNGVQIRGAQSGSSYIYNITFGSPGTYVLSGNFRGNSAAGVFSQTYAVTPEAHLVSALYDNFMSITFYFDKAINTAGSATHFDCDTVLTGLNATSCQWTSADRLVATVNSNQLGAQVTSYGLTTVIGLAVEGTVTVQRPAVPIYPSITMATSSQPSFCSQTTITTSVDNGFISDWTSNIRQNNGDQFVVPSGLAPGRYYVTAHATNQFGWNKTQDYSFVLDNPTAVVSSGGASGTVLVLSKADNRLSLQISPSCLPPSTIYNWTITNNQKVVYNGSSSSILVPKNTFSFGNTYTASASLNIGGVFVQATSLVVNVNGVPPRVVVTPGLSVAVGVQQSVSLDASQSQNLESTADLLPLWALVTSTSSIQNSPVNGWRSMQLDFTAGSLPVGQYNFSLQFTGWSQVTFITVTVLQQTPPSVSIQPLQTVQADPSSQLVLYGSISEHVVTTQWTVQTKDLNFVMKSSRTGRLDLYIPAGSMSQCNSYLFTLTATTANGTVGFVSMSFSTTCPPVPPTDSVVTLNPPTGQQLYTLFDVSTSGWTSPFYPLTFTFSYYSTAEGASDLTYLGKSDGQITGRFLTSNSASNITIVVTATDSFGGTTTTNQTVYIAPAQFSVEDALSLLSSNLSSNSTDASSAAVSLSVAILKAGNLSSSALESLVSELTDTVITQAALSNSTDTDDCYRAIELLSSLAAVMNETGNNTISDRTLTNVAQGIIHSLSRLKLKPGVQLEPKTLQNVLKVALRMFKRPKAKTSKRSNDPSLTYKLLEHAVAANFQNRVCDGDEDGPVSVDAIAIFARQASSASLNGNVFGVGDVNVTFGSDTVPAGSCYNLSIVRLPFDLNTESAEPSSITAGNSSVVSVSGLTALTGSLSISYPLKAAIDVTNAAELHCAYRSDYTQPWSMDNTVTTAVVGQTLICDTTHLTEFVVQRVARPDDVGGPNSNNESGLSSGQKAGIIIGSLAGAGILIAAIVAVAFIATKNRSHNAPDLEVVDVSTTQESAKQPASTAQEEDMKPSEAEK